MMNTPVPEWIARDISRSFGPNDGKWKVSGAMRFRSNPDSAFALVRWCAMKSSDDLYR